MKTTSFLLTAIVLIVYSNAKAQTGAWNVLGGVVQTETNYDCQVAGNLYVNGEVINMVRVVDDKIRSIQGATVNKALQIVANNSVTNGPSIQLNGIGSSAPEAADPHPGLISYCSYKNVNSVGHQFLNYNPDDPAGAWHSKLVIGNNGRVTIGHDVWPATPGVATTNDVLTVKYQMGFYSDVAASQRAINGNAPSGLLSINSNTNTTNGASIDLYGQSYASPDGRAGSLRYSAYGSSGYGHIFSNYNGSSWVQTLGITNDQKVVIGTELMGTALPNGYRLFVYGGILTEKLKVASAGDGINWSDFVFNDDYNLMPLNKVESYIKANKHLPEIPSAKEVAADGIDVAEIDAKLLQKIEELTLYVIQQQKQLTLQQNEIDKLKKRTKY